MKKYVVGFLFDIDYEFVLLVGKTKPQWQAGKLNGVGGHVEDGESFNDAMLREGQEELGVTTKWKQFAIISGPDWLMHCYYAADREAFKSARWSTDVGEDVVAVNAHKIDRFQTIPNLKWMIPMILYDKDNHPYLISELPHE